jgi:hypothetical protein
MQYEIKDHPLFGKVLAESNRTVITNNQSAKSLAKRFNGSPVKAMEGRYVIKLADHVQNIQECDCENNAGGIRPQMGIAQNYSSAPDHEVQMARQEVYRTAKLAIMLHELLRNITEQQGLEGWISSKITRAADYIETVYSYLEYEMAFPSTEGMMEDDPAPVNNAPPGQAGSQNPNAPAAPGQASANPKVPPKTPGMVKMAKVDTNGNVQGQPIIVPSSNIKSKQMAGFHVIGESASAGASSAGGVASNMGAGNGFANGGPGTMQRRKKPKKMSEGKVEVNFTPDDIKRMEQIRDLGKMKEYAKHLISTPSAKPMQPQKVAWLSKAIESKKDTMGLIKLMYDLMLGGEGNAVIGTRHSMAPNSYRELFKEDDYDKSHLGPYDCGGADSWYGRRYSPHKYVELPDGSRKRVELTDPSEIEAYAAGYQNEGGQGKDYGESIEEAKNGLYANVHAKRERIKHGSGEHMRKAGEKGRPTAQSWKDSAKTAENESLDEIKQRLDPKCWKGKHKEGTKIKGGIRVNNCVPNESVAETGGAAQQAAIAIAKKKSGKYDKEGKRIKEADAGTEFTGYWKGTDKGKPGNKMVGSM